MPEDREPLNWSRVRARSRSAGWIVLAVAGMALVAYTDWRVATYISVGYLYLLPLVLMAVTVRSWKITTGFVVAAAVLREAFGPFEHSGLSFAIRNVVVVVTYALVVFFVRRQSGRQQELLELVTRQRDQVTRDLEEAAAVQRLLIPSGLPVIPGWDLAARLYPARFVSGDFYDVWWDEAKREVAVVIADVAGKGAAAAMLMPVVQATVRRLHAHRVAPDRLAARLNNVIAGLTTHPRLVSLVYIEIDTRTGSFRYVNMGHPPPVYLRAGAGTGLQWLTTGGPVAGAVVDARYEVGRGQLSVGEALLFYTDGASEAESPEGEIFAESGLSRVLREHRDGDAAQTVAAVHDAIERFRRTDSTLDDTTLVLIRRSDPAVRADAGKLPSEPR